MQKQNEPNLLSLFLGRDVRVQVEKGFFVEDRLTGYQIGNNAKPHKPFTLILENTQGKYVLRGNFVSISEVKP